MDTPEPATGLIASVLDEAGLRELTLDRPDKGNAISLGLAGALRSWIARSAEDGCKGLILRSRARQFCAGFDFSDLDRSTAGDLIARFVVMEEAFQQLRSAPFVSFALVDGAAYGAGADLAIACTYRIGTARARFRFPGFQFGVALGTRHLARVAGMQSARDILLRNRVVGADEALASGLLTHLVEETEMRTVVRDLAAESGSLGPNALRRIHVMTAGADDAADLADLVRSLSEPGLHERMAAFRGQQR